MATLTMRQLLIRTLTNIGEPVAAAAVPAVGTAITDSYQLQVCNFINHIKEETENEHQWSRRWQTFTMSYVAGNTTQQIIDKGGSFLPTGAYPYSDCQVVRIYNPKFGKEVALCFDITTFGIPFVLDEMPQPDLMYYNTVLNQTPVAYSTNFVLQDLGNDQVNMLMYPGANSTRNIQITLYNPQQYIDPTNGTGNQTDVWNTGPNQISLTAQPATGATTGTLVAPWPYASGTYSITTSTGQVTNGNFVLGSASLTGLTAITGSPTATLNVTGVFSGGMGVDSPILMPSRILEIGAAWWALEERGEELGTNSMFTEERYRTAMDDLVGKDRATQGDLIMIPS